MSPPDAKRTTDDISDLKEMLIAYAKQETIEPIVGLRRYLGFGVGGAVLVGHGLVFLGLAALRALQTETGDTFGGNLSFVPYLIVLLGLGLAIGLAVRAIDRNRKRT